MDPIILRPNCFGNSYIIVLLETHPLAKLPQLSLQALADELIILPDLDALPFYAQIVTRCQELGFEPKIAPNIKVVSHFY